MLLLECVVYRILVASWTSFIVVDFYFLINEERFAWCQAEKSYHIQLESDCLREGIIVHKRTSYPFLSIYLKWPWVDWRFKVNFVINFIFKSNLQVAYYFKSFTSV